MSIINIDKVTTTMRSLFRFCQLTENNAPEMLIDTERQLLKQKFEGLNADEIYSVVANWKDYKEKQETEQTVGDINCEKDCDTKLNNLN